MAVITKTPTMMATAPRRVCIDPVETSRVVARAAGCCSLVRLAQASRQNTSVTLTFLGPLVMLLMMPKKLQKPRKSTRAPRIRVPNNERALFTVNTQSMWA